MDKLLTPQTLLLLNSYAYTADLAFNYTPPNSVQPIVQFSRRKTWSLNASNVFLGVYDNMLWENKNHFSLICGCQ